MDKCIGCNYYDRQGGKETDARGVQWGQCRRGAPMLHPINQKTYMIEGVWPHVRDDDWCGEWKAAMRRIDSRPSDALSTGPLLPISGASPFGSRAPAKPPAPAVASFGATASSGAMMASGRGD